MNILNIIKTRRSVRKFKRSAITHKVLLQIMEAGRFAPSGMNNQPWRFIVLDGKNKNKLAKFTHYASVIKGADKVLLIFLDKSSSYNYEKDLLAIGACVQNMLLYTHSIKLGACWLGEILNKRKDINALLGLPPDMQLEAVLALGKPRSSKAASRRKKLSSLILKNQFHEK